MEFTPKQERKMIARRFCNHIEKAAIEVDWTDIDSSSVEDLREAEDRDEVEEIVERMDRNLEHIAEKMDSAERVEDLINQEDKERFLFPWFRGNHYRVEVDGDEKKVIEGAAVEEREQFKKQVQTFVEENKSHLDLLESVLGKGEFGEIAAKELLSDIFVAFFPLIDGKIEYSRDEKTARFEVAEKDGWSEHFELSSASTLRTPEYEALSDLEGFDIFEDDLPLDKWACQVSIAGELVSLVQEVIEEVRDESEDKSIEWNVSVQEMDLTENEYQKISEMIEEEGWEDIVESVLEKK